MKYASSTLLFAEYVDQKATDTSLSNDLVKTTLEFLIGNEFVAVVQPGQDDVGKINPLENGKHCMCINTFVFPYLNSILVTRKFAHLIRVQKARAFRGTYVL